MRESFVAFSLFVRDTDSATDVRTILVLEAAVAGASIVVAVAVIVVVVFVCERK